PPYTQKRSRDERVALARAELGSDVVLSGSIAGWDPALEDAFDLVVFLWVPTEVRLARLRERELRELGRVDEDFLAWAAAYDDGGVEMRSRVVHERWLAERT